MEENLGPVSGNDSTDPSLEPLVLTRRPVKRIVRSFEKASKTVTQKAQNDDDCDGNQPNDQPILHRTGTFFIHQKRFDLFQHDTLLFKWRRASAGPVMIINGGQGEVKAVRAGQHHRSLAYGNFPTRVGRVCAAPGLPLTGPGLTCGGRDRRLPLSAAARAGS